MTADDWAARLATGRPIAERVAIVVAHPDDETLWTGALLPRLADGLLIHLTDGAPADMGDAHRHGFATRDAYAAARAAELDAALDALGYTGERRAYGIRDQDAVLELATIEARLATDLAGAAVVVTHPYEGGHPDHDAAALAVARVAGRLGVPIVEFACYHRHEGDRHFARFWPGPTEHTRPLSEAEQARLAPALAAYVTQADVIGDWQPTAECWRAASSYDFTQPPPPDEILYDGFGWDLTSAKWRALADPPRNGEGDRVAKRRGGGAHHSRVPPIVERARKSRREMSHPEVLLWQRLKGSPGGIRFRKQHTVSLDCIADFYCASARLVIEVDGEIHSQPGVIARDANKDATYRAKRLTVLRVPARDILRDADGTADAIVALASELLHHRPAAGGPPPQQAGEDKG